MPQIQLPFFPHGATEINVNLAVLREGDTVTYICSVKLHREKGTGGSYEERPVRGPVVLTPPVLGKAQQLFDDGLDLSEYSLPFPPYWSAAY